MKHYHRTQLTPDDVLALADRFFPSIAPARVETGKRMRTFAGDLGRVTLLVWKEGGHYTFVEASTDQVGESRLDRNVKRYLVALRRAERPGYPLQSSF